MTTRPPLARILHGPVEQRDQRDRTAFPTRTHARRAIAEYIEVLYNRQRLHSALGYRTAAEDDHNKLRPRENRRPTITEEL